LCVCTRNKKTLPLKKGGKNQNRGKHENWAKRRGGKQTTRPPSFGARRPPPWETTKKEQKKSCKEVKKEAKKEKYKKSTRPWEGIREKTKKNREIFKGKGPNCAGAGAKPGPNKRARQRRIPGWC